MTPNTHMAVLGKNKWAENEKHKHSWYWAGGGEETLHSLRLTIPLSQRQKRLFIDFLLCLLLCIWLPQCDHTCRPSRNWSRWGCWVYRCCCKGQSGSLVNQAIRQNHCSEEDVLVCGPNAWSSKKSSQKWGLECAINKKNTPDRKYLCSYLKSNSNLLTDPQQILFLIFKKMHNPRNHTCCEFVFKYANLLTREINITRIKMNFPDHKNMIKQQ